MVSQLWIYEKCKKVWFLLYVNYVSVKLLLKNKALSLNVPYKNPIISSLPASVLDTVELKSSK